jgi:hypothetical protein
LSEGDSDIASACSKTPSRSAFSANLLCFCLAKTVRYFFVHVSSVTISSVVVPVVVWHRKATEGTNGKTAGSPAASCTIETIAPPLVGPILTGLLPMLRKYAHLGAETPLIVIAVSVVVADMVPG